MNFSWNLSSFALLIFSLAAALPAPAQAQSAAQGVWQRDTGTVRIQLGPCGEKMCGTVVWVRDKDSPTKVGMRIFYDAEQVRPNVWEGKGFNPIDKQTYLGSMTIVGDSMTSTGCILGRLICNSFYWKRVK